MSTARRWVIGRGADCDLVVNQPAVSTRHCCLIETAQGYSLEDLQSANGVYVNGQRISGRVRVSRADRITLGSKVPMPWPDSSPSAGPRQVLRIGRAADNDIVLDYPMVSAHHARIILTGTQARIEDLGSTNGTSLGHPGQRIQQAPLSPDDIVFLGSLRLPAARLLQKQPALGNQPQSTAAVGTRTVVFGRDPSCDQVLDDPTISSRHARLYHSGNDLLLEDLGSSNGTHVNGKEIHKPARLQPGDVIGLGSYTFTLNDKGELEKRDFRGNVTLEARGVTIHVPGKRLLQAVSLTIFPSEFVGLMGPSGAGKTTLMNALNGYTPPTRGAVYLNGEDLYAHFDQFRTSLGYVPQDDILHPQLTVGQALYYSARLRLPSDYSAADIQARIKLVLAQLEMSGTENVLIGSAEKKGISGGQRKRVNLAMELLTDPLVLFLDEPTSGLSSEDALLVMKLLRGLANTGKTILMTIHQPSLEVYRLLDNLVLVSRDASSRQPGQLVYYGPAYPDAIHFFNPDGVADLKPGQEPSPDEVLRGLRRARTDDWVERYRQSTYQQQYVAERAGQQRAAAPPPKPRWSPLQGLFQWRTLVARALAIKLSDRLNTLILLLQAPVIGILIVLVFGRTVSDKATGETWPQVARGVGITLFIVTLAALWFGSSNAVREIVAEWAVYRRERMVNLKLLPYVGSKFALLGGLCVLQCSCLLTIVWWGCDLRGSWLALFGVLLLTALVGVAVGLLLSAVAKTSEVAIALLPIVLLTMVVLGGGMQPIYRMHDATRFLCLPMPSRWSFEGLLLLESSQQPSFQPPPRPTLPGQPAPKAEEAKERDMAESYFPKKDYRTSVRTSVIVLVGLFVVLAGLIVGILRIRDIH